MKKEMLIHYGVAVLIVIVGGLLVNNVFQPMINRSNVMPPSKS